MKKTVSAADKLPAVPLILSAPSTHGVLYFFPVLTHAGSSTGVELAELWKYTIPRDSRTVEDLDYDGDGVGAARVVGKVALDLHDVALATTCRRWAQLGILRARKWLESHRYRRSLYIAEVARLPDWPHGRDQRWECQPHLGGLAVGERAQGALHGHSRNHDGHDTVLDYHDIDGAQQKTNAYGHSKRRCSPYL